MCVVINLSMLNTYVFLLVFKFGSSSTIKAREQLYV